MLYINADYRFVDGIFLLKLITPTRPSLLAMSQNIENLYDDFEAFEFCTPTSEFKCKKSCTFVFNKNGIFYYTLYFLNNDEAYEIIIKSYQHCAYFFLNFLEEIFSTFSNNEANINYHPNKLFNLVQNIISEWPKKLENKMDFVFPTNTRSIEFTQSDFAYHQFKPSNFFHPNLYSQIFLYLISMSPILLVVPDAAIGCRACFSAFSLLYPLKYIDPMILWLRKNDPRYTEIIKAEKSPYLIVATSDPKKIQSKFDLIIYCSKTRKENQILDGNFENYVKNIMVTIQSEFLNLLNKNPYSDILNLPWAGKNMANIVKNPKFQYMPSMEILKKFEKTETVKYWRLRRSCHHIREIILQNGEIEFEQMNEKQLETVYLFLQRIQQDLKNDNHVRAVIKKHKATIYRLLSRSISSSLEKKNK